MGITVSAKDIVLIKDWTHRPLDLRNKYGDEEWKPDQDRCDIAQGLRNPHR